MVGTATPIDYGGVQFPSLRSACNAAGIRDTKVAVVRRKHPEWSPQEAFDFAVSHRRNWSEEEKAILCRDFPKYGAEIPELCERYSKYSIQSAARRMGLEGPSPDILYTVDDMKVTYAQALRLLNVSWEVSTTFKREQGFTEQQVIDRLLLLNKKNSDGTYTRLAACVTLPEERYIHAEGKWWSLTAFCRYHPEWDYHTINYYSVSRGLSLQRTFEFLSDIGNHLDELDIKAGGLSGYNSNDLTSAYDAYKGTDGKPYVFCKCAVCKRVLLMDMVTAISYRHGDSCLTYALPEGMALGWEARGYFNR